MIQQWTLLGRFQIIFLIKCFLVVPFVVLCVQCTTLAANERLLCTRGLTCMVKKETLDFFVVGDTGGKFTRIQFSVESEFRHQTQTF